MRHVPRHERADEVDRLPALGLDGSEGLEHVRHVGPLLRVSEGGGGVTRSAPHRGTRAHLDVDKPTALGSDAPQLANTVREQLAAAHLGQDGAQAVPSRRVQRRGAWVAAAEEVSPPWVRGRGRRRGAHRREAGPANMRAATATWSAGR